MEFKSFIVQCQRVLKIARKPSREEYKMIVKMSAIGITIIGFLGFLITFAKDVFF